MPGQIKCVFCQLLVSLLLKPRLCSADDSADRVVLNFRKDWFEKILFVCWRAVDYGRVIFTVSTHKSLVNRLVFYLLSDWGKLLI